MDRYIKSTRIVRFTPGSDTWVNLTTEFYAAADPDISFDGTHIIFSGKKEAGDRWQIWRMQNDGSDKEQITKSTGDCFMPVHAGNRFYLNDTKPTPQIIYAGNAHNWQNIVEKTPVLSLYGTDPEGITVHRLSFNLYNDFSPDVLPDGRIIFPSWQLSGTETGITGRYAFMGVNNDGTDIMTYYGNQEIPVYKDMITVSDTDHRVYFIESDQTQWLGGGDIVQLSQHRPLHSYKKLTSTDDGLYHSPCPTPDGGLLSSYKSLTTDNVFSIHRINPQSGKIEEEVYKQLGWHSIDIQLLRPHPQVKGRSNWLIPGAKTGVFYCLDSYITNMPYMKKNEPGTIRYVRLFEGLPVSEEDKTDLVRNEVMTDERKWLDPRRILGTAPVEKDGSFHVRVPAETPINFQLLDKNYLAVGKQEAWTWVAGNENRGCIGCHENRELSPPNILADAVIKPAIDLSLSDKKRTIDFKNQVAPIIKAKCATDDCHVSGKAFPSLMDREDNKEQSDSRLVFEALLKSSHGKQEGRYIIPGNAKNSPMVWHILDLQEYLVSKSEEMQETSKILNKQLSDQEKKMMIEWVDSGAYWDLSDLNALKPQKNKTNNRMVN
jgi:hypothetical protein